MSNSSINLVNLDFATLKSSLKTYMSAQDVFKDYNFDGSAMDALLDVLAYNTYKNAFYLNMVGSEGFLDSAQMKGSIYSHAKELNYLPKSARSSSANITISFTATGVSQPYVIRKGETFSTIINQNSYVFSVADDQILSSANTTYTANFNVYEGLYVTDNYVVLDSDISQTFTISNISVDTDSISVLVYEHGSTTPSAYSRATSLLGLNSQSKVYFVQASSSGKYEIVFGDNVMGKRPLPGSTVIIDYRGTAGAAGNGAKNFVINFDPTGSGELTSPVTTVTNKYSPDTAGSYSANGDDAESIESVKFYAPRHFQTQERAITTSDYETILKMQYPEIGAISVYGGEDASPPRYGKVFVAIDIKNVDGLPTSKKNEYYNFLKSRMPLSIEPIFIQPEMTYVQVNSRVKYDVAQTTRTTNNIKAGISLAITEFAAQYLNNFKAALYYSKLTSAIDAVDNSIISNQTKLSVYKKFTLALDRPQNLVVDFNMPLRKTYYVLDRIISTSSLTQSDIETAHSLHSSSFVYNGSICELEDNGAGVVRIIRKSGHVVVKNIGTVDYETGRVLLNNFEVDSYNGNYFNIYITPREYDVVIKKNEILYIESSGINVTVEPVRT